LAIQVLLKLLPIAREGFFAQLWAQAPTCKDSAPFGGIDARFSTNPVALAFPTPGDPMIADFSISTISMGKVRRMIARGERAPEKIFMDKDGNLTDDPRVAPEGGSILFAGGPTYGYKGYALSLWAEALTAMAGASANNPDVPQRQSVNLTVIDPEAFAGRDVYDAEMKRFVAHMKSSRLLPGVDAIRLPGEAGFRKLREAVAKGVPLDGEKLTTLNKLARKYSIPEVGALMQNR
jgi:L-lactate dehydrogenase